MATVIRHGAGSHHLRADRVYRTGVLAPMVGFQPQTDVQAIAQAFTQGPPLGTVIASDGLGGFRGPVSGAFTRAGAAIKAWFARARASRAIASAVAAAANMPASATPSIPVAPESAAANQVAPQMQSQMQMLLALGPTGNVMQAADTFAMRRYLTYYKAG